MEGHHLSIERGVVERGVVASVPGQSRVINTKVMIRGAWNIPSPICVPIFSGLSLSNSVHISHQLTQLSPHSFLLHAHCKHSSKGCWAFSLPF